MLLNIINYFVRGAILVIGIVLLSGVFTPRNANPNFYQVMGVIFILFGAYRLISYYSISKKYKSLNNILKDKSEDENENE